MHYTSVLFDLDGTLLDTLGDLTAAMNRTLTRHGLPERTRQQMRTALGNGARRLMELSVPSGTDSALFETLLAEYNADYAAHCRIETAPYPGVAALLRTLHTQGRKLAIVSNKPDEAVRALRADFFADAVQIAVGETAAIRRKPAPDMLLAAMEQLGATVWAEYMPETFFGLTMTTPWFYSALYNGSFMLIDMVLVLVIGALLWKPLKKYITGEDLCGAAAAKK